MDYSSFRSKKSNFIDEFNTKFHLLIADTIIKNPNFIRGKFDTSFIEKEILKN